MNWQAVAGFSRIIKLIYAFIVIILVISGCGLPGINIKSDNMIPVDLVSSHPQGVKTLKLALVNGGTELPALCCTFDQVKIDNATFEKALLTTLQNSGIFREVLTDSTNGDYELMAEIGSQENNMVGFLTYGTTLLVNYSLIDKTTNKEIWREHIFSDHIEEGSFSNNQAAMEKMNETAARKNLTQFMLRFSVFMKDLKGGNLDGITLSTGGKE